MSTQKSPGPWRLKWRHIAAIIFALFFAYGACNTIAPAAHSLLKKSLPTIGQIKQTVIEGVTLVNEWKEKKDK